VVKARKKSSKSRRPSPERKLKFSEAELFSEAERKHLTEDRRRLNEGRRLLDRAMGRALGFGRRQHASTPQVPLTAKEWYMRKFSEWPKPPDMEPFAYARQNEEQMKVDHAAGKVLKVLGYVTLYKRHRDWLKTPKTKSR
jgi:hypothetical protein